MASTAQPPELYICPISMDLMRDPVNAPDGRTYDRSSIVQALALRGVSPFSGAPMSVDQLIDNFPLRQAIDEWCFANNVAPTTTTTVRPTASGGLVPPTPAVAGFATTAATTTTAAVSAAAATAAAAAPPAGRGLLNFRQYVYDNKLLVQLVAKDFAKRGALNVVVVVDISGSMSRNASLTGSEQYALTLLDVVKHAARTVNELLEDGKDSFGLVSFSDKAGVVHKLAPVTAASRKTVASKLARMRTDGSTNLWAGIETGLESLRASTNGASQNVLLVLTDGEPNEHPSIGELASLEKYRADHRDFSFNLMTMALGFDTLASGLLSDLSKAGSGNYTYISDAGMIGSVFVNSISSLFCKVARDITIKVSSFNRDMSAISLLPYKEGPNPNEIIIPSLQAEQQLDVLLELNGAVFADDSSDVRVEVTYTPTADVAGGRAGPVTRAGPAAPLGAVELGRALTAAGMRADLLLLLEETIMGLPEKDVRERLAEVRRRDTLAARTLAPLLKDMQGQVLLACSPQYLKKWGLHYLRSLAFAHQQLICNNFKDAGVQAYKTTRFEEAQGQGDALFNSLPPPVASGRGTRVTNMATLNNEDNPCMHGDTLVHMADGSTKLARHVVAGDRVLTGQRATPVASVVCVVETRIPSGRALLVTLPSGLRVTPYHPVLASFSGEEDDDMQWAFPITLAPAREEECDAIFSFVLSTGASSILINNTPCISLGHGIASADPVASHPYFAQAAVQDLCRLPGWTQGHIVFRAGAMVRSRATGLVCGFDAAKVVGGGEAMAAAVVA